MTKRRLAESGIGQGNSVRIGSEWWLGRLPVLLGFLAMYLLMFFVLPVGTMVLQGLTNSSGALSGEHLQLLAANPVYLESLINSLTVAAGAALLAGAAALPIALFLWRYNVRPSSFIELCGFLPLFVPPFVLAVSLQTVFGRGGALGFLLEPFGDFDPVLIGLSSLVLVEALHYFPLVLMTLIMTSSAYSQQASEAASLGSDWGRLTRRVFLPLAMPGLAFGMSITFLKTLDDLATPLALGITNMLSPQAFFRVSTYGAQDPLSSLMAALMVAISGLAWFASIGLVQQRVSYRSALLPASKALRQKQMVMGSIVLGGVLLLYALCYSGLALSSVAHLWSYSVLPESFVLKHFIKVLQSEMGSFVNTLAYCGFAAVLDVLVGLTMAYVIARASPFWKKWLTWAAVGLLSVPGVALAIAYLQFFRGVQVPFLDLPIDATWFLLSMAFSVRGLPFAIRACTIALQAVPSGYLDAAHISGGSRFGVVTKIVLPMMAFGLFVAFILCFGVAAVDLSSAMLLVPTETSAPVAYNIYLHMQSRTGQGVGAALAILSFAMVALFLFSFVVLIRRNWKNNSNFRKIVFSGS